MARKTVRQDAPAVNNTFAFMAEDGALRPQQYEKRGSYIRRDRHYGAKRFCTLCNKAVSIKLFRLTFGSKDGLSGQCQPCIRKRRRLHYAASAVERAKNAAAARMKTYGLQPSEFEAMLERQGHKCEICREPLMPGKYTHVDHCHTTGKVRDLLCAKCNTTLGFFEKRGHLFNAFEEYVRKHQASP